MYTQEVRAGKILIMKYSVICVYLMLATTIALGQEDSFQLDKFQFDGVPFYSEKEAIENIFGPPEVRSPKYECGFHSDDQPGGPYYQLVYSGFHFIGSVKEKYLLEEVEFQHCVDRILKYDGHILNGKTTLDEFKNIFRESVNNQFQKANKQETLILQPHGNDDGAKFSFRNGKLIKFEYWSPC